MIVGRWYVHCDMALVFAITYLYNVFLLFFIVFVHAFFNIFL